MGLCRGDVTLNPILCFNLASLLLQSAQLELFRQASGLRHNCNAFLSGCNKYRYDNGACACSGPASASNKLWGLIFDYHHGFYSFNFEHRNAKLKLLKCRTYLEDDDPQGWVDAISGIVHLLDDIQDQAAERIGERKVFGKL